MIRFTILFSFLMLLGLCAFAQQRLKVGKIKDGSGSKLSTARLKLILVLDHSGSMNDNQKIVELNEAANVLFKEASNDPVLAGALEVAVVAFESQARIVRNASLINQGEQAPQLSPTGGTNMADGLSQAAGLLGNDEFKPIVILITDGLPDNASAAQQAAQQLSGKAYFYALGVTGSDFQFLDLITNHQTAALSGKAFKGFFKDMTLEVKKHYLSVKSLSVPPRTFSVPNRSGWKAN